MSTHQPMTEVQPTSCKAHTTAMAFPGFPFRVSTWTSSDLTLRNEGMPTSLGHHSTHPVSAHSFVEVPTGGVLGLWEREEHRQRWLSQSFYVMVERHKELPILGDSHAERNQRKIKS